jgi:hypothetical protein
MRLGDGQNRTVVVVTHLTNVHNGMQMTSGTVLNAKSTSSHLPDPAPGRRFFHPDGVIRSCRAPGSSFSPGIGP